jgi:murein L,D-transpeptidase YcbB/YkuD
MSIPLISFFFILIGFATPAPPPAPFGGLVTPEIRSITAFEVAADFGLVAPADAVGSGGSAGSGDFSAPAGSTESGSFMVSGDPEVSSDLLASGTPLASRDPLPSGDNLSDVAKFYQLLNYSPAWVVEGGLSPEGEELLSLFRSSHLIGLEPSDYFTPSIQSQLSKYRQVSNAGRGQMARDAALLDVSLTNSFLRYARHKSVGRVDPRQVEPDWPVAPQAPGLIEGLANHFETGGPREAAESVEARHPQYRALLNALRGYRALEAAGGWAPIPDGSDLALRSRGPRVTMLRKRLDLQVAGRDSAVFDAGLKSAVEAFQKRHGLSVTGKVDKSTLAALNVPVDERIRQIELSLERARWLPAGFGSRYILVNIPEAVLRVVREDSVVFLTRAVIGKASRQTPVLVDTMTSVVLNPSWNLPPVVVDEDVLPKLARNTDYLKKKNIKVYRGWGRAEREIHPDSVNWARWTSRTMPYHLRMEAGPANALGRVKFLFPNDEHVYIHDSPQRSLYRQEQRLYSSGCVRIERARDLASYLLTELPRWDKERLAEVFASGEEKSVALARPIPVYFVYFTAWVGPDGSLHFRPDVYGRDQLLAAKLADGARPS